MRTTTTIASVLMALALAGCSGSRDAVETTEAVAAPPSSSAIVTVPTTVPTSAPSTAPDDGSAATSPATTAPPSAAPVPAAASPSSPATTAPASPATPATTPPPDTSPLRVAWIGGSEVELRDVSLPAVASGLGLSARGRPLRFDAITTIAASADDTHAMVSSALAAGAEALIATVNPQWLYGRVCEGIEPPHARYACLLADGEIVGAGSIDALMATIAGSGVPTVLVLMPTSVDALENPELTDLIALANDRLRERIPARPGIRVLDESLTGGRPEFREGAGFHDMVHTTPDGARLLAGMITAELVALLDQV